MASKKIEPVNPNATAVETASAEVAGRKTASASGRFRKLASVRFGRKTNSFKY